MKFKKLLFVCSASFAFMCLTSTQVSAARLVPKSMRGTWYFQRGNELVINRFTKYGMHQSTQNDWGRSKSSFFKLRTHGSTKLKISHHAPHRYSCYTFDTDFAYTPYKMKIAGRYQRVILTTMQQGHSFGIYTHFMPAKMYTVPVHVYH